MLRHARLSSCHLGIQGQLLTQIQLNGMSAEYVESLSGLISTPMLIALCVSPIVGGAIGALIAKGLFSKHFRKAGIV